MLAQASMASDAFTVKNGLKSIRPPILQSVEDYRRVTPSLNQLGGLSPVALALACLVDLFTIYLTFFLESVPIGFLKQSEKRKAFEEIMKFTQWAVNDHNHLEFQLTKTESERSAGINTAWREFFAALLLNRGLLKRVYETRAEFAPRLYRSFTEMFCVPEKGEG